MARRLQGLLPVCNFSNIDLPCEIHASQGKALTAPETSAAQHWRMNSKQALPLQKCALGSHPPQGQEMHIALCDQSNYLSRCTETDMFWTKFCNFVTYRCALCIFQKDYEIDVSKFKIFGQLFIRWHRQVSVSDLKNQFSAVT